MVRNGRTDVIGMVSVHRGSVVHVRRVVGHLQGPVAHVGVVHASPAGCVHVRMDPVVILKSERNRGETTVGGGPRDAFPRNRINRAKLMHG